MDELFERFHPIRLVAVVALGAVRRRADEENRLHESRDRLVFHSLHRLLDRDELGQLDPGVDVELPEDVAQVRIDGVMGDK
jgi:hypothetical protein